MNTANSLSVHVVVVSKKTQLVVLRSRTDMFVYSADLRL